MDLALSNLQWYAIKPKQPPNQPTNQPGRPSDNLFFKPITQKVIRILFDHTDILLTV